MRRSVYAALVACVAEAFVIVSAGFIAAVASPCSFPPCLEEPNPAEGIVVPLLSGIIAAGVATCAAYLFMPPERATGSRPLLVGIGAYVVGALIWLGFLAVNQDVLPNEGARWFACIGIFIGWIALLGAAAQRAAARVPSA